MYSSTSFSWSLKFLYLTMISFFITIAALASDDELEESLTISDSTPLKTIDTEIVWEKDNQVQAQKIVISESPSLAEFNGRLYCAYQKGSENGQLWYTSTHDGDNWDIGKQVRESGMSASPSLAVFHDRLYCARQGYGNNEELWLASTLDGENWDRDDPVKTQNVLISESPSLAVFNGRLYCAYQKGGENGQLWYTSTSDGNNWDIGKRVGEVGMSRSPSLAVFNNKNKLYCARQGYGDNGELWYAASLYSQFLSGELIEQLIKTNFPTIPDYRMYYPDRNYMTLRDEEVKTIWEQSELNQYKWTPEKFDCDDFAYCLKAQASKWIYNIQQSEPAGAALGIMFGKDNITREGHAYNFYITPFGTIKLIEPQNGRLMNRKDYTPIFSLLGNT